MLGFLLRKVARLLLILLSVELLVFLLVHSIPGSPWDKPEKQIGAQRVMANISIDDTTMAYLVRYYGLDLPLWRQFTRYFIGDVHTDGRFVCGVVCGNLGPSIKQRGRSVQDILFSPPKGKGPWNSPAGFTIRLVTFSFLIVALLGIPLGVTSAFWAKSWFEKSLLTILTIVVSIPIFVLGLISIIIFASGLKWINVIPNWTQAKYWILPVVLLAMIPMSNMVWLTRAAMLDAMSGDYIRTARAKGLGRSKIMWKHVLPNAMIAILTFLLPIFVELLAASFVIEAIFSFPGFGREYWSAINDLDYARIMGITLIYACGIAVLNLILDSAYRLIDPRLRVQ